MSVMLNNYTILVGFIKKTPKLVEDEYCKGKCCLFTLSTRDHHSVKEVPCLATGLLCEQFMAYGKEGTFWAIGGILSLRLFKKSKKESTVLKCVEIELLKRPTIPGITVEEFVEGYSPKAITKRVKERKNGKN